MRNPASDFSFLSYLHEKQRLVDFLNHETMFPTRVEYHDYPEWAAARLDGVVRYDSEGDRVGHNLDLLHRVGELTEAPRRQRPARA